jgi:hypothetical protein
MDLGRMGWGGLYELAGVEQDGLRAGSLLRLDLLESGVRPHRITRRLNEGSRAVNSIQLNVVDNVAFGSVRTVRQCGACQECCEQLGVKELGKPHRTRCQHEGDQKCLIYDARPDSCGRFACFWLMGMVGDEDLRPDRSGLVISPCFEQAIGEVVLDVHQSRPHVDLRTLGIITRSIETIRTLRKIQYIRWHPYVKVTDAEPPYDNSPHQMDMFYFPSKKSPFLMVHVPREKVPEDILKRMSGKQSAAERGGENKVFAEDLIGDSWLGLT